MRFKVNGTQELKQVNMTLRDDWINLTEEWESNFGSLISKRLGEWRPDLDYNTTDFDNQGSLNMYYHFDNIQNSSNMSFDYLLSEYNITITAFQNSREIGNIVYNSSDNPKYRFFYSGYNGTYDQNNVYASYMFSNDGMTWTDAVNFTEQSLEDPYLVRINSTTWILYAEDKNHWPTFNNITAFMTTDFSTWTDLGDVLTIGTETWEDNDVSSPAVIKKDGIFYMLYEGRGSGAVANGIGLANSTNGINWTKISRVIAEGEETGSVVAGADYVPDAVVKIGNMYYMTFHTTYNNGDSAGMANSSNLLNWTFDSRNPFLYDADTIMIYERDNNYYFNYRAASTILNARLIYDSGTPVLYDNHILQLLDGANMNDDGVFGGALVFDGIDDYILSTSIDDLWVSKNSSLSFWFNANVVTETLAQGITLLGNVNSSTDRFIVEIDDAYVEAGWYDGSWNSASSDAVVGADTWNHVVVTKSDSTITLYLNGEEQSGTSTPYTPETTVSFTIGGLRPVVAGNLDYFNGTMDEIIVFNRTISSDEARELYVKSRAKFDYTDYQTSDQFDNINTSSTNILAGYKFDSGNNTDPFYSPILKNWEAITLNYTDFAIPGVSISSPTAGEYDSVSVYFNLDVSDLSPISSCWYTINSGVTNYTMSNDSASNFYRTHSVTENGSYTSSFYCNDTYGNLNDTENVSFSIRTIPYTQSGSGSSGFWLGTIIEDKEDISDMEEITKQLSRRQKLRIRVNNEEHYIGVVDIKENFAVINISSMPQQATLYIGDEQKFDVNEDNYYDLNIKLNNIKSNNINITLKSIYEEIPAEEQEEQLQQELPEKEKGFEGKFILFIMAIIVIVVVLVLIFLRYHGKFKKSVKKAKK